MILHGLSPETLARLLSVDSPRGDLDDSWLLYGPTEAFVVEPHEREEPPLRWAAE